MLLSTIKAYFTAGVHQGVWEFPSRQAPLTTLGPQFRRGRLDHEGVEHGPY